MWITSDCYNWEIDALEAIVLGNIKVNPKPYPQPLSKKLVFCANVSLF